MNQDRPRLYIDLTTTSQEKGRHPHGTTRVDRSIVAALAETDRPDISFFIYSRATNRFSIVSRQEALGFATTPTRAEVRREMDPPWRRHPLALWARGIKRSVRSKIRNLLHRRAAGLVAHDVFAPRSTLLFPGELQRQDFGRLIALKRMKQLDLAFVFYDLLDVLPDSDTRLLDPMASDLPATDFLIREATLALAISRYSAGELRKHVARRGVRGPTIDVIRLASQLQSEVRQCIPVSGLQPGQFVLTVGDVLARKNHALLARVWKMLIAAGATVPVLVIVGRIDEECYELVLGIQADADLRGRFMFEANVDDDALVWLYANCRFTVFPSFVEGFGLPVAESLGHGKVCIASSAAAIPEAGQGLAIELDPTDDKAWFKAVHDFCQDDKILAVREAEIARRFHRVTWHDTVADILGAIEAARIKR